MNFRIYQMNSKSKVEKFISLVSLTYNINTNNLLNKWISIINKRKMSLAVCPDDVLPGNLITKEKRQEIHGIVSTGSGTRKPEIYQRYKIVDGTGLECKETTVRINWRQNSLVNIRHPMKNFDGYDYTENFDGIQEKLDNKIYINLKCVVGKGGSQTRTLRDECYRFVNAQLEYLKEKNEPGTYFANIFDGDEAYSSLEKFNYLKNLPEYGSVKNRIYVGDLKGYFQWFNTI